MDPEVFPMLKGMIQGNRSAYSVYSVHSVNPHISIVALRRSRPEPRRPIGINSGGE